jgi:hypothetical protein
MGKPKGMRINKTVTPSVRKAQELKKKAKKLFVDKAKKAAEEERKFGEITRRNWEEAAYLGSQYPWGGSKTFKRRTKRRKTRTKRRTRKH